MIPGWRTRALPWLIERACRGAAIEAARARWVPQARGDVLELGVGTGLNLAFYAPGAAARVTAIDPAAPLLARAAPRAAAAPVPVTLVEASAEALPFDRGRFDAIVVTYALCSVGEPARALAEARRVLAPGGALILVEHGRAPDPGPRRWQRWLTPAWRRVSGGCHLDRDVPALLAGAGFATDALERGYADGVRWLTYTYQGVARAA